MGQHCFEICRAQHINFALLVQNHYPVVNVHYDWRFNEGVLEIFVFISSGDLGYCPSWRVRVEAAQIHS